MASTKRGTAGSYTRMCESGATETKPGAMNFYDVRAVYQDQVMNYLNEDGYIVDADGNVFLAPKA